MNVIGYDPEITVDAAWSLPSPVKKATSVDEVLRHANFVTLHVPLVDATRHLVDAGNVGSMKPGAVLLNFSRDGVVDEAAVLRRSPRARPPGTCATSRAPRLGAARARDRAAAPRRLDPRGRGELRRRWWSTRCATTSRTATIANAVNFPAVSMPRESRYRVAIANANVPNMLGQISTAMARAGLNIHNMVNKSRGDMAYTLVDVDSDVGAAGARRAARDRRRARRCATCRCPSRLEA